MVIVACVVGVKRGRGNLGARSNNRAIYTRKNKTRLK